MAIMAKIQTGIMRLRRNIEPFVFKVDCIKYLPGFIDRRPGVAGSYKSTTIIAKIQGHNRTIRHNSGP